MQVLAGPSGRSISKKIADYMNYDLIEPEYKIFPDGESYLRINSNLTNEILVVQSCFQPQDTNLFQLLNIISTLKRIQDPHVTSFVPYLCYARADREVKSGEAISARTVIQLLEAVGCDHLITLDVHNPEIFDYAKKMSSTNIYPVKSMKNYLLKNLGSIKHLQVVAPDEGALFRAELLGNELGVDFTHLKKTRNSSTGEIGIELGEANLISSEIVIVDDIISTGSTLVEASNLLKMYGAERIHYLISHVIGTESVNKLKEIGNGLVAATNSIPSIIGQISPEIDLAEVILS